MDCTSSTSINSPPDFDLEDLVQLEQTFFDAGYADGHAHGRMHGLIEGRAFGRDKGYELWEEIGFYEGFAKVWGGVCKKSDREKATESRADIHIRHLLDLVSQFPRVNPKRDGLDDKVDVMELLSKIRARYKAVCATIGVKPRLIAAGQGAAAREAVRENDQEEEPKTRMGKKVWKLDGNEPQTESSELSF